MEQKKTLWIIAAVGAFLLFVLGIALILNYPTSTPQTVAATTPSIVEQSSVTTSPWTVPETNIENNDVKHDISIVEEPGNITNPVINLASPQEGDRIHVNELTVLAENASIYGKNSTAESDITTIDLNALKQSIVNDVAQQKPSNINITVTVPDSEKPRTAATKTSESQVKEVVPRVKEKEKVEAKTRAQVKPKPVVTQKAPAASVKKTTVTEEKKVTQYWVQVAAYSNKKGAENARAILDSNKIPADIFTHKDNKDNLFYRVRVGPYMTKSEAEYWRSRIVKISEFSKAESYVTSTTN